MSKVFINLRGSLTSGGPTVAAARLAQGFAKKGHKVIYDKPNRADVCLCIIESGKLLKKVNRYKTKLVVRLDGAYLKGYWHSKTPDRMWRPDMTALHAAIKRDVNNVDHMIYQSQFSKQTIDTEIAKRDSNYSIIHNGVDINLFRPLPKVKKDYITLFHHGVIRNDYIINGLFDVLGELRKRSYNVHLKIVGKMDAVCSKIFTARKNKFVQYMGPVANKNLPPMFSGGDIGLYNRQGSSNDNCVIEALSSGLPVVIPKFGGNSELISDGVHGVVVDSNNWNYDQNYINNLANGVEQIISDLDGFSDRARKHAVKNLGLDLMVDRYLKAFGI